MNPATTSDVRPSPIAGTWYPGSPETLAASIREMLAHAAPPAIAGRIIGLVAPHAGHRYSGPVAAHAFQLVDRLSFERVVVISPMHHPYDAPILTTSHHYYQTPLGLIPVDRQALQELAHRVRIAEVRRDPEHSLEIELPFLQVALAQPFSLIPLMLRIQRYDSCETLGKALADVLGDGKTSLLVASSDLSHFYPEAEAHILDRAMLDQVAAFDPEGVIRLEEQGKGYACGRAAIATVLVAARALGANCAQIVGYGTSGDTSGDRSRVVGYGAAAIFYSERESKSAGG